jgi:hypothetical protein
MFSSATGGGGLRMAARSSGPAPGLLACVPAGGWRGGAWPICGPHAERLLAPRVAPPAGLG